MRGTKSLPAVAVARRRACEIAYGRAFLRTHRALADAVDDYARSNGVTDDLVAEFAPLAKGDTIMTFMMAGESLLRNDAGASAPPPMSQQPARARGGRGRRGMSSGPAPAARSGGKAPRRSRKCPSRPPSPSTVRSPSFR
jgi:hypothetical protein